MLVAARSARASVCATRPAAAAARGRCAPQIRAMASSAATQVLSKGSAEPAAGADRLEPTFVTTWSCPYAQRTWIALNAKQLNHTPVFVDLQDKPEWFFRHNPYGRVPTLVWREPSGEVASLYESLIVNEYLADLPGPALLPADAVERARARLVIDQFGAKFSPAFGKVMFAADPAAAAAAGEELNAAVRWLEAEAAKSSGPFFMGPELGLVDAAIIPFIIRLGLLEQLAGYTAPADTPRLTAWKEACLAHPAVQGSMQPPDASRPYLDQMADTYKDYIAKRRAAAAAAAQQ